MNKEQSTRNVIREYERWLVHAIEDDVLISELKRMDEKQIDNAFYRNLEFGTGGLRGVIGAGTNCMNIYTVAKASQGLANYVCGNYSENNRSIAIAYDSRINSEKFAKVAAEVFAANNVKVYLYKELMPTPCLSFAVRQLKCSAGIVITASHNPAMYNGYKVYGSDGCQITTEAAKEILNEIECLDIFTDVKKKCFEEMVIDGKIEYIPEDVYTSYINEVKKTSLLGKEYVNRDISIVYTPLNGTGLKPVMRALKELGYTKITVVPEQEKPDGNFSTCPYPNPEIREAMALGIDYAKKCNADILLATDPDCDRVGIAVRDIHGERGKIGEYVLLSGNEVGALLLDYICSRRIAIGTMPENPIMIKSIVTTDMGEQIASHYGVRTINVLTGFKFIGEQIGFLEKGGKEEDYIFGFEESYGYLSAGYVRDKDAVNGALLICEMFSYYASKGIGLIEKLTQLYSQFGYRHNTLNSYEFKGSEGSKKISNMMEKLRSLDKSFGDKCVLEKVDYSQGINNLPKADVLKFVLADSCSVVARPSGTEPKIKFYIDVCADNYEEAVRIKDMLVDYVEQDIINKR